MDAYRRFLRERPGRLRAAMPAPAPAAPPVPRPGRAAVAPEVVDPAARRAAARSAAVAWAAAVAEDPRAVYVDTETTGCGAGDEVIELAVVGNDGTVLFETLLRPRRPIPAAVVAVHGITDADVAGAPTLPEVRPALLAALAGRLVVVYNAPFDRRLIEQTCRLYGGEPPAAAYDCAMRRYADFAGVAHPSGRGGYRWHKLERAVLAFGAAPGGHRATADALACRAVVHGMAGHWLGPDHPAGGR
jgi:DNA polymerase-3 subunit epsilon